MFYILLNSIFLLVKETKDILYYWLPISVEQECDFRGVAFYLIFSSFEIQ